MYQPSPKHQEMVTSLLFISIAVAIAVLLLSYRLGLWHGRIDRRGQRKLISDGAVAAGSDAYQRYKQERG